MDQYKWCAIYRDDTMLHEDDAEQGFASVNQDQVKVIVLLPLDAEMTPHHVSIPDGAMPVCFRRRSFEFGTDATTQRPTVHCIGWKQAESAVYLFVFHDRSTLLTDDLQAA